MKHPVKRVRGRALWFGPEVEGVRLGLYTAFVRRKLSDRDVKRLLNSEELDQLFLTEEFRDWKWLKKSGVWEALWGNVCITKACMPNEVSRLKKQLVGVRLFVRIRGAWIHKLHESDQISIGVPYDLFATSLGTMAQTQPSDYDLDVP